MKITKYGHLIIIFLIILCTLSIILYNYYKNSLNLQNEMIIARIGEPYLMEDTISPFNCRLTADYANQNGGLSYLHEETDAKNRQLIHDYYKDSFDKTLPNDTKIVFGGGTTMMIAACYYALHKKLNRAIDVKTNSKVCYVLHKKMTKIVPEINWKEANMYADLSVIVSPSNPLGVITDAQSLKEKYILYDVVYDKYIFTGQKHSVNESLYEEFAKNPGVFIACSFSKLGIAGVRFGFLLTRDEEIAKYAKEYVDIISVTYPTSNATVARLAYYKHFNKSSFDIYIYKKLEARKAFFLEHAPKHGIELLNIGYIIPYIYTDKSVEWWIETFNVETRPGEDFDDTNEHSRFNIMISDKYWNEFMRRFRM